MKRYGSILVFLIGIILITACGGQGTDQSPASDPKKIIGSNDLVVVTDKASNVPKKYRPLLDAVGRMSIGCTGTHIGDGLVITAGHCLLPLDADASGPIMQQPCDDLTIEFGYRKSKKPVLVGKCQEIVVAELNDHKDYGIFRVDVAPNAAIPLDREQEAQVGQDVTIFSHPAMRSLEWSKVCKVASHEHVASSSPHQFSYQCDTEGGSSGSAVIDVKTLRIVGIHNGRGSFFEPYNYATLATRLPDLD